MPANRPLTIWRGNTFSLPLRFKQSGTGTPVNLTGSTFAFLAIWPAGDWGPAGTFAKSLTLTDAVNGRCQLDISVAESRTFPLVPPGVIEYEIERRIGGAEKTWLYGFITTAGRVNADG